MADFTPHEAAAHEALSLPVMLPPKLVGRDVTLARVYSQLKENKPVLIYGPAGIGKTALAGTLASAYSELPGGVLWLNVQEPTLTDLVVRIGRAYGNTDISASDNPLSMVNSVATLISHNKPLIVLDGALNVQAIHEFLGRCASGVPVLLINEEELTGPWTSLRLGKLEPEHSLALFKLLAEITDDQQESDIQSLASTLGYMPFALVVAAGAVHASQQPVANFLSTLPQTPGATVTPPLLALTASFRALNNALQGLLLVLGATPTGAASAEMIGLIGNAPQETITQALNMLVHRQLVERIYRYGEPYYCLHEITHTFAQSWLRGSHRLEALQNKVRDSVLEYVRKHSSTDENAANRLAMEMDLILATARASADSGDREMANQLAIALMQVGDFINARGYVYELLTIRRLAASSTTAFPAYSSPPALIPLPTNHALEVDQPEAEEEDLFEAEEVDTEFDNALDTDFETDFEDEEDADADESEAEDDEALFRQLQPIPFDLGDDEGENSAQSSAPGNSEVARLRGSVIQARQSGDKRQQAEMLITLAQQQEQGGMKNEAISTYSEALTLYESLNDTPGMLSTLESLAKLTVETENSQAAVLHATRGVSLAQQHGNEISQMRLLIILGDARQQLGESDSAIHAYNDALALAKQASDERSQAILNFKIGYAQLDDGDPNAAIQTWEETLNQFRAQGRRDYEARTLGGLGAAYGELNRWAEAINFHTSALHLSREVNDKEEEALQLSNLGYAAVQSNQLGEAVLRYRQALHLAYESSAKENIVSTTVDLARLLVESPQHLSIAELLVDTALTYDPNDRDLKRLKERIEDEREALGYDIPQKPVAGKAQDYAANAYQLLEK
jgi:tetratricopeptide (TPR) repeat protein